MWLWNSPWMLFWTLAAVVPVLIHFWSRRRHDEVPWAAMRFLLVAIRKNARRWRIEQLVLLALRMLILILLAIALADPMMAPAGSGATRGGGVDDTHYLLVLDASYSMDYRPADTTCFELAKGLASELVRRGSQGDAFTLILLAAPPDVVVGDPVFDRESMVAEIAQLQRTDGGADLPATLAEIEQVLQRASQQGSRLRRHRVCFFTDLGRNTWGEVVSEAVQAALGRLEHKAEWTLVDVGQAGGENVAMTRLAVADDIITPGAGAPGYRTRESWRPRLLTAECPRARRRSESHAIGGGRGGGRPRQLVGRASLPGSWRTCGRGPPGQRLPGGRQSSLAVPDRVGHVGGVVSRGHIGCRAKRGLGAGASSVARGTRTTRRAVRNCLGGGGSGTVRLHLSVQCRSFRKR